MSALVKDLNREYNDVETALNRIQTHKGVQGIVIATHEGRYHRSYAALSARRWTTSRPRKSRLWLHNLLFVSASDKGGKGIVRDLDPEDELVFLRIRSKKHEIMVAETKQYQ
jgi:dynein light chain roadblock-type